MSALCVLMPVVMIITYSPVAFFHFQSTKLMSADTHTHTYAPAHTIISKLWTGRATYQQSSYFAFVRRAAEVRVVKISQWISTDLRMKIAWRDIWCVRLSHTWRGRIVRDSGNGNRAKFSALAINAKDRIKLFDYRLFALIHSKLDISVRIHRSSSVYWLIVTSSWHFWLFQFLRFTNVVPVCEHIV